MGDLKYLWWIEDLIDFIGNVYNVIVNSQLLQFSLIVGFLLLFFLNYFLFKCSKLSVSCSSTDLNNFILHHTPEISQVSNI